MKRLRTLFSIFLLFFIISSPLISQSKETGALQGTVRLEDGGPVPGVLVSLESRDVVGSAKTTVTNEKGNYRFVGLQPGIYTISAVLEGFTKAIRSDIKIHIGKTFSIDLMLKQGKITEEVVVQGKAALVDVKESATASLDLTSDYLQNIPNSQFTTDAVNLAPGISNNVAYGAAQGTGVAYQIDGVDVSDPAAGTAWVFLDYNVVEEVSISGIGAPAEYGNFTGIVFNTVTKSGTNQFKGYAEFLYQGKDWNSKNSDDPNFLPGAVNLFSTHIDFGGPIIKDKLSFFFSGFYQKQSEALSGTDYNQDFWQPKGFLKFSWQPSTKTRINAFVEHDQANGNGRYGGALTEEVASLKQKSPETIANFSIQHLFSDYTFFEGKVAFFSGYFDLIPRAGNDVSGHVDWVTGWATANSTQFYRGDRSRLQANVSVTHHADDFIKGNHDFKFGADVLYTTQRDKAGFTNGAYFADLNGAPYLRMDYEGYDIKGEMATFSLYAQDTWSVSDRLTINPGIRMDISRGGVEDIPGTEYKTKPAIAPRVGFSYDVLGDHSTAIKAHWGRYFEGAYLYTIKSLSRSNSDFAESYWDGNDWVQIYFKPGGTSQYIIEDKLNQSYMDQLTFGIERELLKNFSCNITYIHRKNYDQIAALNIGGEYEKVPYEDPNTGQTYMVWAQTNNRTDNLYLITNPKKGDLTWIEKTPYRKYDGIEILFNKRFSNKWQLIASYVYSKAKGNVSNTYESGAGFNKMYENPNSQINAEGKLENDYTHMLKIQGSVILPFDINFNLNFHLTSGGTYTKRVRLPATIDPDRTYIWLEPYGTHRYPTSKNLDLRLEKTVKLGNVKLGLLLDVFNVFNEGIVDSYNTIVTNFESVISIVNPRAFRAGIRFWF